MSKRLLSAALIAGLGIAGSANAVDGTITINGAVTGSTCTVAVNGTSANTVTMPTVSTSALNASGATAGQTPFSIALSSCSAGITKAATYFEAGPNVTAAGRLKNTGGAGNVDVQLVYSDNTAVAVGQPAPTSGAGSVAVASGAATLNYYARYYATAAATAGSVTSTVQFSMIYN
jgi:major type 1 subunit fimbrin (pilin)